MAVIRKFKAFETRAEAKQFVKEQGGLLLNPKTSHLYYMAASALGVDTDKHPHIVTWNEEQ